MSNRALNACRPAQMPPTPKNVLMAIADRVNDDGEAWPSIPGISEATCYRKTAVIEAIKWLERAGFITVRKASGKNNRFSIDAEKVASAIRDKGTSAEPVRGMSPSGKRTGTGNGPVRETDYTRPGDGPPPVRETDYTRPGDGPEPSVTITQPSKTTNRRSARKVSAQLPNDMLPPWMPIEAWRQYTAMRDEMRKPMSVNAQTIAIAKLAKWREDGHDPKTVIENSVMGGYQGLFEPKGSAPKTHVGAGDPKPDWATHAGFANCYEAENAGCFEHNAAQFRNGQRCEVPA
ncbi:MAG: helix-turn-helix domain-containing protein [Burkholderiales bacterium]|nr:helix-turn-helix domain-containing protein [Burkholderiales bacterium]